MIGRNELDAYERSTDQIGFVSQISVTSCSSAVAFFSRTPRPPPFSSMNSNSIGNWLPDQNKKTGKMNFLRENDYSQVVSAEGPECGLQRVRASADDLRICRGADYGEAARNATQS